MENRYRPRRTCLSVPGSSPKMIQKAKTLPADQVFLDLEDAVAPDAKSQARAQVAAALAEDGWAGQLRGVRGWLATGYCLLVLAVAFVIPLVQLFYWLFTSGSDFDERYWSLIRNTLTLGGIAAVTTVVVAMLQGNDYLPKLRGARGRISPSRAPRAPAARRTSSPMG